MGCSSGSWPECPAGTARYEVLRSSASDEPLTYRGTVCLGAGGPATPQRVTREIDDAVIARLLPLHPHLLSSAVVRHHSSRLTIGVPAQVNFVMKVAGVDVMVNAQARVTWKWPDASSTSTMSSAVEHLWRTSGRVHVPVSAVWTANYRVAELGPFAVEQTITQSGSVTVMVRTARSVLVPRTP